uniref:Uncharacterized protein n=1 Tax=Arundo donax TaxID=35708 RepID=A0A0A9BYE9_ARUDO
MMVKDLNLDQHSETTSSFFHRYTVLLSAQKAFFLITPLHSCKEGHFDDVIVTSKAPFPKLPWVAADCSISLNWKGLSSTEQEADSSG